MDSNKKVNYTDFEKNLLAELVSSRKSVIENKLTSASMIFKKENAWKTLAKDFNVTTGVENQRTWVQLRKKWGLMKSTSHKEIANERRSRRKTGGGEEEQGASNLSCRIANFLPSLATPLQNVNDSDAPYFDDILLSYCDYSMENDILTEKEVVSAITDDNNNEQTSPDSPNNTESITVPKNIIATSKLTAKKKAQTLQQRAVEFAKKEHEIKMKILDSKLAREMEKRLEHQRQMQLLDAQMTYWTEKTKLLPKQHLETFNDSILFKS